MKEADFYRREADSLRARCVEAAAEKQRLEAECQSVRAFVDEGRKEVEQLRRQQQVSEQQ